MRRTGAGVREVSIPFIAGQWSLRRRAACGSTASKKFQSPSLRGSGRFRRPGRKRRRGRLRFNPLHCGAVVASRSARSVKRRRELVSIPFIAGQWSLRQRQRRQDGPHPVSIPFIAGQWSLRVNYWRKAKKKEGKFQSPSLRGSGRFCGASSAAVASRPVSIPFIAGQWSLLS